MRALFDVSFLLALLDADHVGHERARTWWSAERAHGWASCPLTQNGFIRIISQPAYASPRPIGDALGILDRATRRPDHAFWPDDVSVLDEAQIDRRRLLGPRQLTDVYLLALAVRNSGRLVTLDTGIAWRAARGASEDSLVVIA